MARDLFSSDPPFTPPTTEEDRLSWLRLIRSARVGPTTFMRLMTEHGTAQAALDALPDIAQAAGVRGYVACSTGQAEREMADAARRGARMLCLGTPHYPVSLAAISDPPPVLWCLGQKGLLARSMIALVGARNASSLGTRTARKLAEGLGYHGFCVVSGLARGIDAAAHHGALKSGTVAVLAGGVDVPYPTENSVLASTIADQGLLMSEQPMGLAPQARHFPRRNRIISGLARAIVVVEAAEKSGSLITARDALDQGREIMAVPGHPIDGRAGGCNQLIRQGAILVRHVDDIVEALSESRTADTPLPPRAPRPRRSAPPASAPVAAGAPAPLPAGGVGALVLDRLSPSPVAEDQLIRDIGHSAATVSQALVALELDGAVRRHPGGLVSRA